MRKALKRSFAGGTLVSLVALTSIPFAAPAWADGEGTLQNVTAVQGTVSKGNTNTAKVTAKGYVGSGSTAIYTVYKLSSKTGSDASSDLNSLGDCKNGSVLYSYTFNLTTQSSSASKTYTSPQFGSGFATGTYGVVVKYSIVDPYGQKMTNQYADSADCLSGDGYYYVVGTSPNITTQPSDATILNSSTATLNVAYDSDDAATVQWQKNSNGNWSNISGATGNSYQVSSSSAGETQYRAIVSNDWGSTTSSTATVKSIQTPVITTQPEDEDTIEGGNVELKIEASNTYSSTVQWYSQNDDGSWAAISGANDYSVSVSPSKTTKYHAVVSNNAGSATSDTATVTFVAPPSFDKDMLPVRSLNRQPVTLKASYQGVDTSIQWYIQDSDGSWVEVEGATEDTLTVTPTSDEPVKYKAKISNIAGSQESTPVLVTVVNTPTVTQQSSDTTIKKGGKTTLSATSDDTSATFQWQTKNSSGEWTNVSGATKSTYEVSPTSTTTYRAQVTNDAGVAYTDPITVTVTASNSGSNDSGSDNNGSDNNGSGTSDNGSDDNSGSGSSDNGSSNSGHGSKKGTHTSRSHKDLAHTGLENSFLYTAGIGAGALILGLGGIVAARKTRKN